MSKRIPTSEWLPFAPEQRGKSIRINHNSSDCSGDSKSLVITRKQNGDVDAFCHRCAGRGFRSNAGHFSRPDDSGLRGGESEQPLEVHGYTLPSDATDRLEAWPEAPRDWVGKAGVTAEQVRSWEFRWSEEAGTLYLPVWKEFDKTSPELAGYVLRAFEPKRYLTLTNDKAGFYGLYRSSTGYVGGRKSDRRSLVLVEDVLSARKVAAITDSMALLGVNLRPKALEWIINEGYDDIQIFLDGDNSRVKGHARKLAKAVSFLPTRIVETGLDPKDYPEHELRALLDIPA